MNKIKHYLRIAKTYITERNELFIGIGIVAALLLLTLVVVIVVQSGGPKIVYQPAKACDLFTPSEAQGLLGDKVIGVDTKDPEIVGNVSTSKCSYTDSNADTTKLIVAAIAVRSGINDEGVAQNKSDFASAQANNDADIVTGVGQSAFFNKTTGQLNVLNNRDWLIVNYGVGTAPESNTPEKAVELAKISLR